MRSISILFWYVFLQLFDFANSRKGTFDGECPFYCSFSGYNVIFLHPKYYL